MFALLETTRGSGKRLFFYSGERVYIPPDKQKKAVTFPDGRVVTFEHDHKIHAVPSKKLGHSNPLSGWLSLPDRKIGLVGLACRSSCREKRPGRGESESHWPTISRSARAPSSDP